MPDALVVLHGLDDGLLFGDGAGQRLLAVNVLLVPGGLDGHQGVPMVRHGQHDGINVGPRHQFAVIVVSLAALVLVMLVDLADQVFEVVLVHVAGGHHPASGKARNELVLPFPMPPHPTIPRAIRAEGAGWPARPSAALERMVGKARTAPVKPRNWRRLTLVAGDGCCIFIRREANRMYS